MPAGCLNSRGCARRHLDHAQARTRECISPCAPHTGMHITKCAAALFVVGAGSLCALGSTFEAIAAGRVVVGVAVGISSMAVPLCVEA